MVYRTGELEVPADDPFKHDRLERKGAVIFLADLIERAVGPFVIAVDGPWGTGKTTFIRMLHAHLARTQFQCICFNAWEVDYVTDPLVAMVAAVDDISLVGSSATNFKDHLKTVRKVTTLVAKRGAVAAVKALTVGALDMQEEVEGAISEFTSESLSDIVDAFQKEKELLTRFRTELDKAIKQLPASGKKPTLVFFVDELDRCRPTFAIELLERVKHLFNVPNVVFVLAIDKAQLEASTAAIYGNSINASEYLRRFIDIDFALPQFKGRQHTEGLMALFQIDALFSARTHDVFRGDREDFISFFTLLADVYQLSLRARERCFTRMRLVMDQTAKDQYLDPILAALLVVMRAKEPGLFTSIIGGELSARDVMQKIEQRPGGKALIADHMGVLLEANLMAADGNDRRVSDRHAELKKMIETVGSDGDAVERAKELVEMCRYVPGPRRRRINLGAIAKKIDLAANVRD